MTQYDIPDWQKQFVAKLRAGCPQTRRGLVNEIETELLLEQAASEIVRLTSALVRIRDEDHAHRNDWWRIADEELGGLPTRPCATGNT